MVPQGTRTQQREVTMPAMGPDKDHANRRGDMIADHILTTLRNDFRLSRPSPDLPLGAKFCGEWDLLEARLRDTVKEMVWVDMCTSF